MNTKQQRGVEILTRLDAGALEVGATAGLLGVTPREIHPAVQQRLMDT